jgi:hypothetical protein
MNEKKHINYSAADIERYHKGLMTAKEMNALEKAALDDPFLADALEGYAIVPVQAENDIALLDNKLEKRISESKIIPLRKTNYTWLRIAAAFIIIAGAGVLAYNSIFQYKKRNVATIEQKEATDKQNTLEDTAEKKLTDTASIPAEAGRKEEEAGYIASKKDKAAKSETVTTTEKEVIKNEDAQPAAAPVQEKLEDVAINKDEALNKPDTIKQLSAEQARNANGYARAKTSDDAAKAKKEIAQDKNKFLNEATVAKGIQAQNNKTNYFRGQVMDANNSPLPFANVTIVPDNIGTYTDVKGNFVLISPDSILDVKIRSVGFENNNARLQNNIASNSIILQQDTKNIPSTVLNTNKANTERKRQDNMKVEEPEPADGWYNYDTYIANNIKISDEIKTKTSPSSQVELSFEVNKYGEPINIKVEKSVCKECDEEAIRLLKEGPKWKKKKKSKRAKVSVGFSQE